MRAVITLALLVPTSSYRYLAVPARTRSHPLSSTPPPSALELPPHSVPMPRTAPPLASFFTVASRCSTPPPRELVRELKDSTSYLWRNERTIEDALSFATAAHAGQLRKSGEPFIIHPIATAKILAELHMDCDTIVAALLHDIVEDTSVTVDDVRERFGESVAGIVAGVTDCQNQPDSHNQRELVMAMSADWRIVLVKLADRLHNMRTLEHMPRIKQRRKARETVELYVPLARRMGVAEMEQELLLQSVQYLFPPACAHLPPPVTHVLSRLGAARSSLITRDTELAFHSHRQAWSAHKAEWACSY